MFIDFKEMIKNTSETVSQVLEFVGAEPDGYDFKQLPPGMKVRFVLCNFNDKLCFLSLD